MSDVQFEEDKFASHINNNFNNNSMGTRHRRSFSIEAMLIKSGLARSSKGAFYWQIGIIIVALAAAAFLLYRVYGFNMKSMPYNDMTPEQQQKIPSRERSYIKYEIKNQRL